jgi:hypothetical protein
MRLLHKEALLRSVKMVQAVLQCRLLTVRDRASGGAVPGNSARREAEPAQYQAGWYAENAPHQSERLAMNASDELTRSLWMDVAVADAPQLSDQLQVDTVIVGSGIAGLSIAYELALEANGFWF